MADYLTIKRTAKGWMLDYDATGRDMVEYYDTFKAAAAVAKEFMEELREMDAECEADKAREAALERLIEERGFYFE